MYKLLVILLVFSFYQHENFRLESTATERDSTKLLIADQKRYRNIYGILIGDTCFMERYVLDRPGYFIAVDTLQLVNDSIYVGQKFRLVMTSECSYYVNTGSDFRWKTLSVHFSDVEDRRKWNYRKNAYYLHRLGRQYTRQRLGKSPAIDEQFYDEISRLNSFLTEKSPSEFLIEVRKAKEKFLTEE